MHDDCRLFLFGVNMVDINRKVYVNIYINNPVCLVVSGKGTLVLHIKQCM